MARFAYVAKNIQGRSVEGILEAESPAVASACLQRQGLFITSLVPFTKSNGNAWFMWRKGPSVSGAEVARFTQRLADLMRAGLPLARALQSVSRQHHSPVFTDIVARLHADIIEGKNFSDALSRHAAVFPQFYIGAVRAGQSAGFLEDTLAYLAEFLEKDLDLKNRLRSALAYPALMLMVGLLSVAFLLTFVIPRFSAMFQDIGQALPFLTRALIAISVSLRSSWWVFIILIILVMFGILHPVLRQKMARWWSAFVLDVPLWGTIVRKEIIARFARILKALLHNGVPLTDALLMARESLGNPRFADALAVFKERIESGKKLSEVITQGGLFPADIAEMIAVGEESGAMEEPLAQISRIYERDVEQSLKTALSLFEPLIILGVGCMVGCVALAMLLPIFQVSSVVR